MWRLKKSFWISYNIVSVLHFVFFGQEGYEILAPWPGIKPVPPALEVEVLARKGSYILTFEQLKFSGASPERSPS